MGFTASAYVVILAAFVAANLPFVTVRKLGIWKPQKGAKSWLWHVLELLMLYLLVGALGLSLEQQLGQIYPQGWEFYATTAALFLTLAFPGFVYRFLWRHP